jgi:hypothetical protein
LPQWVPRQRKNSPQESHCALEALIRPTRPIKLDREKLYRSQSVSSRSPRAHTPRGSKCTRSLMRFRSAEDEYRLNRSKDFLGTSCVDRGEWSRPIQSVTVPGMFTPRPHRRPPHTLSQRSVARPSVNTSTESFMPR